MGDSALTPDPNQEVKAAVSRIRDLAKWLLVVLGAIGGALLAGSQIADIGAADDADLLAALIGLGLGLIGVAIAVGGTLRVLTPVAIPLRALAQQHRWSAAERMVRKEPDYLFGRADSIRNFYRCYVNAANAASTASSADEKARLEKEVAEIKAQGTQLVGWALLAQARRDLKLAFVAMLGGGIVVACGIVLFAWATNQAESAAASDVVPPKPSAVSVRLSDHGRDVLTKRIGDSCPTEPLRAIALGGKPDALDLVSVPSSDCTTTRFILTENMGVVFNREPVETLADNP